MSTFCSYVNLSFQHDKSLEYKLQFAGIAVLHFTVGSTKICFKDLIYCV